MIEALQQSLNTKENEVELLQEERNTKEAVLRDKSIELMKIKHVMDKNKETIQTLQQSVNVKEKEIILLKDELRTKEESLKDIEAQGVDLIKVKYELDLKKETIK